MSRNASLIRAFLFIKKNRFRKKSSVYKMAIQVMVDPVIAIYLVLLGGYVIASLFIMGDVIQANHQNFMLAEEQAIIRYWVVVAILPIRYVMRSFRNPGVTFSSSEDQLSILPFTRKKIWLLCIAEKWIKLILFYIVVGTLVTVITPISSSVVVAYILLFTVMDTIMTVPQWKLFQVRVGTKLHWISGIIVLNIGAFFSSHLIVSLAIIGFILTINMRLFGSIFHGVHWGKVMEVSDFKIWNMPLISKASETKFKRQRKYSAFRNSFAQKKPFTYTPKAIHHRIWRIYLGKNLDLILQTVVVLLIMLVAVVFISESAIHIAIAVAIYVYASVAAILFSDRFQSDILHVLPWNLKSYKQSFFKWVIIGSIPLLIRIISYLVLHASIWAPVQLIFYFSTFMFVYQIKIDNTIALLARQSGYKTNMGLGYLFLILVAISGLYPIVSLGFIVVIGIMFFNKSASF
ncbi:hypothetical protein [Virgibacillus necropolis]|uniref:Uncharacterized protein n=1 Tax=Virgibacillus necropolis TaxID=163877 RepID=A0A221MHJ6_9BACI|nr:hypothetical protein [Virgibacillus necropolis]ASN07100.1 hypothetical protein CFK40_19905 [Virgibacillus necropolis]